MSEIYARFLEAVVEARDIHDNNPSLSKSGIVNVNPDLVQIVTGLTGKEIKLRELGAESKKVAAIVLQRKSADPVNLLMEEKLTEEILLPKNLSTCWKRFASCKELVHIILRDGRESESKNDDGENNTSSLQDKLVSISGDFGNLKKEDDLDEERYALYLAVEIMLPWSMRDALHKMKDDGNTHYKIADKFKVPEDVIDLYFNTSYKELSVESNSGL